jgi:hypothetical protein
MSDPIGALESKYRKYAESFGAAVEQCDVKATNRNLEKLVAVGPKLRACGEQGEAVLRRLMKDTSDAVAISAATDCLPFAEADALEVLDAMARKTGAIAFDAEMTARQWRAGELEIAGCKRQAKGIEKNRDAEKLKAKCRKFAEAHGAAYTRGDSRTANRNYDKLAVLLPKLRATADRGEEILRRLMKDPSDSVATWAATHSLPIAEKEALAILGAIARREGIIGFSAEMVIKEWKSGRLTID